MCIILEVLDHHGDLGVELDPRISGSVRSYLQVVRCSELTRPVLVVGRSLFKLVRGVSPKLELAALRLLAMIWRPKCPRTCASAGILGSLGGSSDCSAYYCSRTRFKLLTLSSIVLKLFRTMDMADTRQWQRLPAEFDKSQAKAYSFAPPDRPTSSDSDRSSGSGPVQGRPP